PPVALSRHLSHLSSESFRPHPASPLFPYTTLFRSFRAGILDCGPDRRRYPFGVLVLPEPEDAPSCVGERACGPEIAFSVRNDLRPPIGDVGLRLHVMLRAAVPEAPVDEDCDPNAREDDVRSAPAIRRIRGEVHAIAEAGCVQATTDLELDGGVSACVRAHRAASVLAARLGWLELHRQLSSERAPLRASAQPVRCAR